MSETAHIGRFSAFPDKSGVSWDVRDRSGIPEKVRKSPCPANRAYGAQQGKGDDIPDIPPGIRGESDKSGSGRNAADGDEAGQVGQLEVRTFRDRLGQTIGANQGKLGHLDRLGCRATRGESDKEDEVGMQRDKRDSWRITLYCDKCGKPGLPCFCDEGDEALTPNEQAYRDFLAEQGN